MVENSRLVRTDLPKRLMVISREGFSSRTEEVAIDNDVELVDLEGLLKMLRMEPSDP